MRADSRDLNLGRGNYTQRKFGYEDAAKNIPIRDDKKPVYHHRHRKIVKPSGKPPLPF